jgi:hypothetical protein
MTLKTLRTAYEDSLIEISKEVVWYKLQANIRSVITLKTYADFTDRSDWTNQFAGLKCTLRDLTNSSG